MSKVIDEVRQKLGNGQNLFRRSTIEKMIAEYDRLLMRNTALEKNAVEQNAHLTGLHCPACMCRNEEIVTCARCGTLKSAPQVA